MADAELIAHQQSWKGFTTFVKYGIALVVIVLGSMAIFLL